jgi:hypothetical protein
MILLSFLYEINLYFASLYVNTFNINIGHNSSAIILKKLIKLSLNQETESDFIH